MAEMRAKKSAFSSRPEATSSYSFSSSAAKPASPALPSMTAAARRLDAGVEWAYLSTISRESPARSRVVSMSVPASTTTFDPTRLEAVLAEKRVTQAELARKAGYPHRNVVNKIIRGTREASWL